MASRAQVRDCYQRALPQMARRAGRDRIEELVTRVVRTGVRDPTAALARALGDLGRERQEVRRRAVMDAQVMRAATVAGAEREALTDAVERHGFAGSAREDLAALGRYLDPGAIDDRLQLEIQATEQGWAYTAEALAASPVLDLDDAAVRELVRGSRTVADDGGSRWPVRVAAVKLLAVLAKDPERGAEARHALLQRTLSLRDDAWVIAESQAAYLGLAQRLRPAQAVLEPLWRGEVGTAETDDMAFVRARAVGLAARHDCGDLVLAALDRDPSEHVRMRAAEALVASGRSVDLERLRALLGGHDERAGVGVALAAAVAVASWSVEDPDKALPVLVAGLSEHTPGEVVQVVLEAIWARVRVAPVGSSLTSTVAEACTERLRWWRSHEDAHPDIRRLADVLLTWSALSSEPETAAALVVVRDWVEGSQEGARIVLSRGPVAALCADRVLDILYVLAQDDLDLSAEPLGDPQAVFEGERVASGGYRLHLGLVPRRTLWRVIHEFTHPRHDKRQAHGHLVDHLPPGPLVAWSARMSEVVATTVPGMRVSSPVQLDWGEHLPLPANLLVAAQHGGARLRTPEGVVILRPAQAGARLRAHRSYTRLARLRTRLTEGEREQARQGWDSALRQTGFDVQRLPPMLALLPWLPYISSGDLHGTTELGILAGVAMMYWTATKLVREARLSQWRKAVPFVVGGWGSRGKSSVERLKAALFQGLGYTVLCKSTGCEAMILVGMPGSPPTEVFLYRPRDKATIVEQADVLQMASVMKPQVVLWECMALNPVYTSILQTEWMRDDLATITNTYPDHEDIQGPSGRDVADVISEFTPVGGHLVTSEQHMTPVLRRRAKARGTRFTAAGVEDWSRVPSDVLARFPYEAHRRNIALLTKVAAVLDVPADVAWRTMADHVLPDLGAFKTYGPAPVDGRELTFVNGCSANDRASFLSNWNRKDLGTYDETSGLTDQLVVVINNRADRPARSLMCSRITAMDVTADRVAIIGTNVGPMAELIHEQLHTTLSDRLTDLAAGPTGWPGLVEEIARRMRRPVLDAERARAVCEGAGIDPEGEHGAGWLDDVAWLHGLAQQDQGDVDTAVAELVRRLEARLLLLRDPMLTGDQVLYDIGRALPEGVRATLLGVQNIKGTGLDFVYRWVSIERIRGLLASLAAETSTVKLRAVFEQLSSHGDYGLADARMGIAALQADLATGRLRGLSVEDDARDALMVLTRVEEERAAKLGDRTRSGPTWMAQIKGTLKAVDVIGSLRRRKAADQLYRDLAARRVGASKAAEVASKVVAAEKK